MRWFKSRGLGLHKALAHFQRRREAPIELTEALDLVVNRFGVLQIKRVNCWPTFTLRRSLATGILLRLRLIPLLRAGRAGHFSHFTGLARLAAGLWSLELRRWFAGGRGKRRRQSAAACLHRVLFFATQLFQAPPALLNLELPLLICVHPPSRTALSFDVTRVTLGWFEFFGKKIPQPFHVALQQKTVGKFFSSCAAGKR